MNEERTPQYYKERGAEHTAREILQQPRVWGELGDYLLDCREQISAFMEEVMAIPNLRIVFTGAGSSAFIGESMQNMLLQELGIACETVHTTDIVAAPHSVLYDRPTLLVSYSRSGESPESVGAIQYAQKKISQLYNLVLVCKKQSSLADYAEHIGRTLVLDMPAESCDLGFAMTSSVSCMALATWSVFDWKNLDKRVQLLRSIAKNVDGNLRQMDAIAQELAQVDYHRAVLLGANEHRGLARESAIKLLELTNGIVSATYDSPTGFRHGPKAVVDADTLTVHYISADPFTAKYDLDLLKEVVAEKHGNRVLVVMAKEMAALPEGVDAVFTYELPEAPGRAMGSYLLSLVFAQFLALEKSLNCKITTDSPCASGQVNRVVKGIVIYDISQA